MTDLNIIQQHINQAYNLKRNPQTDRLEYAQAYQHFKNAIQGLLQYLKTNPDSQTQQNYTQIINDLLTQAQNCELYLNPTKLQRRAQQNSRPPAIIRRPPIQSPTQNPPIQTPPLQTPQSNQYQQSILSEILDQSPSVNWQDIAGLQNAKRQLHQAIIMPNQYPHLFTGIRAPPKGILLFGPPGTGKTMLAKAVASQSGAAFLSISSASLTSKLYGEGEKLVRAMFSVARKKQPSVVFIDEIDSILTSRSDNQHQASRRLQTEFLVQMDGVKGDSEGRTIIIGATNRPQDLDQAVRRRFTKRVYIDLPNPDARLVLINSLMKGIDSLSPDQKENLCIITHGYSGSDLAALCKEAAMYPLRNLSPEILRTGMVPPVTLEAFEEAMRIIRPSVSEQSLEFYFQWNSEFGSNQDQ